MAEAAVDIFSDRFDVALGIGAANDSLGHRFFRYGSPKSTRISLLPRFSISLTTVPSLGRKVPVCLDRIAMAVFTCSPISMQTDESKPRAIPEETVPSLVIYLK